MFFLGSSLTAVVVVVVVVVVVISQLLSRDGGMAEEHGVPEAGQLSQGLDQRS